MSKWLYTIRERFTPASEIAWKNYLEFSGFKHIVELVTVDHLLCREVITDLHDEDWGYNVHDEFMTMFFRDPDYLMRRQLLDPLRHQILAVNKFPKDAEPVPVHFTHCGYDIVDSFHSISTLTNCGPIPELFDSSLVDQFGLIADFEVAFTIRDRMRHLMPNDPHFKGCQVWSVARRLPIS